MKKGIKVKHGAILGEYIVAKRKGHLTIEEIREALYETSQDLYCVVINAVADEYSGWPDDINKGDIISAYTFDAFRTARGENSITAEQLTALRNSI